MNVNFKTIFVCVALGLTGLTSYAIDFSTLTGDTIHCVVKGAYSVDDSGKITILEKTEMSWLMLELKNFFGFRGEKSIYANAIDKSFSINRKTGVYSMGFGVNNEGWRITVVDEGSKEQSLKILSLSAGGYVHVQYMEVDIYGDALGRKPFKLVNAGSIFTGYCD